nr:MAG TPA: hypothetical protein [Caudoviricetes sp.]
MFVILYKEEGVQNGIAFTCWFESSPSSCFLILLILVSELVNM